MKWILGDGQHIQVWQDNWIPGGTLQSRIVGPLLPNEEQCLVSSLRNNHAWTLDCLQVPLPKQIEQLIRGIPVDPWGAPSRVALQDCLFKMKNTVELGHCEIIILELSTLSMFLS